jgi:hypothetical protein
MQAAGKLGNLFKEQNAKFIGHIADLRQAHQLGMFTFVDKVMACLAENCTCCKAAGRRQCVLKVPTAANVCARQAPLQTGLQDLDGETTYRTPIADKTAMATPARSECDGKGQNFSLFALRSCTRELLCMLA